jgi:malonyl-CoA O-methyltransferase
MHEIGDALVHAGLVAPVLDVERYTLTYTDVRGLAADLRAVGARNATADRLKGLTSPGKFAAMQATYEAYRQDGRLPATYEVVFGQAWAPATAPPGAIGEGNRISLRDVERQLRLRRDPLS